MTKNAKRTAVIEANGTGLYDLTVTEDGQTIETARNITLRSAARIAEERLGERKEEERE